MTINWICLIIICLAIFGICQKIKNVKPEELDRP